MCCNVTVRTSYEDKIKVLVLDHTPQPDTGNQSNTPSTKSTTPETTVEMSASYDWVDRKTEAMAQEFNQGYHPIQNIPSDHILVGVAGSGAFAVVYHCLPINSIRAV